MTLRVVLKKKFFSPTHPFCPGAPGSVAIGENNKIVDFIREELKLTKMTFFQKIVQKMFV